jgi:hypothetical protein
VNAQALVKGLFGEHWASQLWASTFGFVFGGVLVTLAFVFGDGPKAIGINLLLIVLGCLLGWAIGMFFSPFSELESARFQFLGKSIAAFGSGYALSKSEVLVTALMNRAAEKPESVPWDRVGLLSASFLLAGMVTFISRIYAVGIPAKGDDKGGETK